MALFGRKKTAPPSPPPPPPPSVEDQKDKPGHQAVLAHLREQEKTDPGVRERMAGGILFDLVYRMLKDDRGVRIENMLAVLASVAGQECLMPILDTAPAGATMEQLDLKVVKGKDGHLYFFGDPPNLLLAEAPDSVISLAFGAAQALGAPVTVEMIHDEMRIVAQRVGGPDFETLDLPEANAIDRPTEWARVFRPRLAEALDFYDVPPIRRATALGYALQKAIQEGGQSLSPLLAARIVLQCATRTAKVIIR